MTVEVVPLQEAEKEEYTDFRRLNGLVKNYSQFISFPIYTWVEELVDREVPDTDAPVEEVSTFPALSITVRFRVVFHCPRAGPMTCCLSSFDLVAFWPIGWLFFEQRGPFRVYHASRSIER
jgi:hypothetical protein